MKYLVILVMFLVLSCDCIQQPPIHDTIYVDSVLIQERIALVAWKDSTYAGLVKWRDDERMKLIMMADSIENHYIQQYNTIKYGESCKK